MRLEVDATAVVPGQSAGVEEFTYGLLQAMAADARQHELSAVVAAGSLDAWRERVAACDMRWAEVPVPFSRETKMKSLLLRAAPASLRNGRLVRSALNEMRKRAVARRQDAEPDLTLYPFHRVLASRSDFVMTVHDLRVFEPDFYSPRDAAVVQRNVAAAAAVVASWPHPYESLIRRFPEAARKIFLVPLPAFNCRPSDVERSPERNLLIYPSSTAGHKNHIVLIEAMRHLPDHHLVCVGPLLEPEASILQRRVQELGLERRITFTGFVPKNELQDWLRRADCVVVPSLWEAASGAIFEAFSWGIPVSCADVPPLRAQVGYSGAEVEYFSAHKGIDAAKSIGRAGARRKVLSEASAAAGRRLRSRDWAGVAADYWLIAEWAHGGQQGDEARTAMQPAVGKIT